jgi:hypothetical protein
MKRLTSLIVPTLALVGCSPQLVVSVEGADPDLTAAPVSVQVGVYGGGSRSNFTYTTMLSGAAPKTDFTVDLEQTLNPVEMRVAIPTTTTVWFTDDTVSGGGSVSLPLFPGESSIATASYDDGNDDTNVLFSSGVAMAWIDGGGVEVRVERDPDLLVSRPEVVDPDTSATTIRLAAGPNPLGYGPELYGIAWIGGDGTPHLRTTTTLDYPVRNLAGPVDDLRLGGGYAGATFSIAVVTLVGSTVNMQLFDDTGTPLQTQPAPMPVLRGAASLVGVTASRDGIAIGWQGETGSFITLVSTTGSVLTQIATGGQLASMALTLDGSHLLTLQRDPGDQLFAVTYFAGLQSTGTSVSLGTTIPASRVSISACAAVWPVVRDDGSNANDLRFALLDTNGNLVGDTHLLNEQEAGNHIVPTAVCASSTRAYATFLGQMATTDTTAELSLRRIPTY